MRRNARVLLAADDRFLCRACEASLRQRGFDVVSARDGQEGLRLARAEPAPDVVLLDVLMPRLSGIDVLRGLKESPVTSSIPVLMLSNSSRDEDKQRVLQLGADGYYVKVNLSLRDLAAQVEKLVAGRPQS